MPQTVILENLWQEMAISGNLPAVSSAVMRVAELSGRDESSLDLITDAVLADYALTQRILKLANSAMYRSLGENVTSVSQAVQVLGRDIVTHVAIQSTLLDGVAQDTTTHSSDLVAELAQARMTGGLARSITTLVPSVGGEDAALLALLLGTGRILAAAYLPEKWAKIRASMELGLSEEQVVASVLMGISLGDLGAYAFTKWGLPTYFSAVATGDGSALTEQQLATWYTALAAQVTAQAIVAGTSILAASAAAANLYAAPLGITLDELALSLEDGTKLHFSDMDATTATKPSSDSQLDAATSWISTMGKMPLKDQLRKAVEMFHIALGFSSSVLFVFDKKEDGLIPRIWLGTATANPTTTFKIDPTGTDVTALAARQGQPIFIAKSIDLASSLPSWYAHAFATAPSFLVVPIGLPTATLMIHGVWGEQRTQLGTAHSKIMAWRESVQKLLAAR